MEVVDVDYGPIGQRPHFHSSIFFALSDGQCALECCHDAYVVGLLESNEPHVVGEEPARIMRISRDQFERLGAKLAGPPEPADLGRAQVAMLQLEEAMGSLSGAFNYYTQRGDIPRALVVAEHPLPADAGRFKLKQETLASTLSATRRSRMH